MTDTQYPTSKGGIAKATVSGIYLDICQNITPPIVSSLCATFPRINETTWFEIVVFVLGSLGGAMVWFTPQHLVEEITSAIRFIKSAIKEWRDAWNAPLTEDNKDA